MTKTILSSLLAVTLISTAATAAPAPRHKATRVNLAAMNLTPRKIFVTNIATPEFAPDKTPTAFRYDLPAPGMGAVVGYKPDGDMQSIPGYEVNQATAIGFSQPTSTVGAALAYRF
jgi:hypothetical protein